MNEYNFRYISTLQINKMTKESEMERKLDIEGELLYTRTCLIHSITSLEKNIFCHINKQKSILKFAAPKLSSCSLRSFSHYNY